MAAKMVSGTKKFYPPPDPSTMTFDVATGFYYDHSTGFYYDAKSHRPSARALSMVGARPAL